MAMSDLGNTLITLSLNTKTILLKIWFCLMISLMSIDIRGAIDISW